MFVIVVIAVVLGVGWFYWMVKRKHTDKLMSQWHGVVAEKIPLADANQARQYISVTLDNGRRMFVEVSATLWQALKEGDRITKQPGELEPKKGDGPHDN